MKGYISERVNCPVREDSETVPLSYCVRCPLSAGKPGRDHDGRYVNCELTGKQVIAERERRRQERIGIGGPHR